MQNINILHNNNTNYMKLQKKKILTTTYVYLVILVAKRIPLGLLSLTSLH